MGSWILNISYSVNILCACFSLYAVYIVDLRTIYIACEKKLAPLGDPNNLGSYHIKENIGGKNVGTNLPNF